MQQSQTFASPICRHTNQKLQKSIYPTAQTQRNRGQTTTDRRAAWNSTYSKGGVSCYEDSFVVKVPHFG